MRVKIVMLIPILISIILSGCVELIDNWPYPQKLSEKDKQSYSGVLVEDLIKSPDAFENKKVFLRGDVSWILEQKLSDETITNLIINIPTPESPYIGDSVSIRYRGRLPGIYKGIQVKIYGIVKGTTEATNLFGAKRDIPNIYAIQISDSNSPEDTPS